MQAYISEVGLALKMDKPIIGLKTWVLYREGTEDEGVIAVDIAEEAVDTALRVIQQRKSGTGQD